MLLTPELFTNNIPMSPSQYITAKKSSARKALRQFLGSLDVKHKTDVHSLGDFI